MATIINPSNGQQVTVPEETVESYTSRGWVRPGFTPAEQPNPLDTMTVGQLREHAEAHGIDLGAARLKAEIRATIDNAGE